MEAGRQAVALHMMGTCRLNQSCLLLMGLVLLLIVKTKILILSS